MKPGFAKKANKAKAKKAKAKAKKAEKAAGGAAAQDVEMDHAMDGNSDEEIDYTMPSKNEHRTKVELKTALKAKVKQLKHSRNKLTKLPGSIASGGKQVTKHINKQIQALVKEQTGMKQKGKTNKGQAKEGGSMEQ